MTIGLESVETPVVLLVVGRLLLTRFCSELLTTLCAACRHESLSPAFSKLHALQVIRWREYFG